MAQIKALVALDAGVNRRLVENALPFDGSVQIVGIVEGLEETWSTMAETPTDMLVVACGGYSDRALFLIEGAVKQRSERPVVVLIEGSANGFVRRVFEAGADDILVLPKSPEDVRFSLEKALARKVGTGLATGIAVAPMICVLGPKGGIGKTLTSANLAVSLAQEGKSVAAVDLDLQFGDLGLALGLSPERTIYDLIKSGGSLDPSKLDAYLGTHASGVRVLMAPTRPDQAGAITVEFLRDVYATLRSMFDFVIVDTPPGFTPEVIASIDSSTGICMVGMLDSLSLKNTKLGLETLELMGYDQSRIRLILNRADSRVGITGEDVVAIIGRTPDVLVPSDRDIPRAVNEGMPIVSAHGGSAAARAFKSLAAGYLAEAKAAEMVGTNGNGKHVKTTRRGLRGLLLGRR
jgi:pilus assembly protein CpaE